MLRNGSGKYSRRLLSCLGQTRPHWREGAFPPVRCNMRRKRYSTEPRGGLFRLRSSTTHLGHAEALRFIVGCLTGNLPPADAIPRAGTVKKSPRFAQRGDEFTRRARRVADPDGRSDVADATQQFLIDLVADWIAIHLKLRFPRKAKKERNPQDFPQAQVTPAAAPNSNRFRLDQNRNNNPKPLRAPTNLGLFLKQYEESKLLRPERSAAVRRGPAADVLAPELRFS